MKRILNIVLNLQLSDIYIIENNEKITFKINILFKIFVKLCIKHFYRQQFQNIFSYQLI